MADVLGNAQQVHGTRAHGDPASDNPVVAAGRANASAPAAVNDGDTCDLWTDQEGRVHTLDEGTVAHDAVDSGNPVKIGGKANANEPSVVADGDRVDAWFDRLGRLVVVENHPTPESPARAALTTTSEATLVAAPGASVSIWVTDIVGSNDGASRTRIDLKEGAGGTVRYSFVCAPRGGGFSHSMRSPWKLPANTALVVQQSNVGDSFVTVNYYLAP